MVSRSFGGERDLMEEEKKAAAKTLEKSLSALKKNELTEFLFG